MLTSSTLPYQKRICKKNVTFALSLCSSIAVKILLEGAICCFQRREVMSRNLYRFYLLAIYLWTASREQLFTGLAKRPVPAEVPLTTEPVSAEAQPVTKPPTVDQILDGLLAGKNTRDEAAKRIRSITSTELSQTEASKGHQKIRVQNATDLQHITTNEASIGRKRTTKKLECKMQQICNRLGEKYY
jgi:hypothetical protein